jgi:hypothetical protein
MDIKFTHRLSYKQARLTVLAGFILGAVLSMTQIWLDYASVNDAINRQMRALLDISHNPASRIVYNIDRELAKELTQGLLQSESIVGARLTGPIGSSATFSSVPTGTSTSPCPWASCPTKSSAPCRSTSTP